MAKIRKINKILTEDFPATYRDLVSKLAFALNPFLDNIVQALDKGLTITDNLNGEIKVITITADNDLPLQIRTSLNSCNSILVSRVTNLTNTSATLASAPFVEFKNKEEAGFKLIEITNITGISVTDKYRIRLILLNE